MEGTDESIVIYPSRGKLALFLAGALAFVAVGVWMVAVSWTEEPEALFLPILGAVCILFFGYGAYYLLRRLVVREPSLIIGADGLLDHASATGVGFLAWDEIEVIVPYRFQNQRFLGIFPLDLEAVLRRQPALKQKAMKMNMALGAAPVNIPENILPMRVDALARMIAERYQVHVEMDP